MRKNIIFALCAIIMMVTLTACGNEKTPSYTIEYRDNDDQQVTTSSSVSDENPANVDNSGHEPDSYKSGNFQDYWEGDSYFDIVSFALANGMTSMAWRDNGGEITESESNAMGCAFYNSNTKWSLDVYNDYCYLSNHDMNVSYMIVYGTGTSEYISVCKGGDLKVQMNILQALNTILDCLKTNGNSSDPLAGSGLSY